MEKKEAHKMKTQYESEILVCNGVLQILLGILGREKPKNITCHIFKEMIFVRVWNKYTSAEDTLMLTGNGGDVLKIYRHNIMMGVIEVFKELINKIFIIKLINFHHDITIINGEEILIFTLESIPDFSEVELN